MTQVINVSLVSRFRSLVPITILLLVVSLATVISMLALGSLNELIVWCANFFIFTWSAQPIRALSLLAGVLLVGIACFRVAVLLVREFISSRKMKKSITLTRDINREEEVIRSHAFSGRLRVIHDERPRAVTHGLLNPQIILTTALLDLLSHSEIRAILLHESHHVLRRDPLRRLLWASLQNLLFFIPIVHDVAKSCIKNQEFLADVNAIRGCELNKKPLRSAVSKLLMYEMQSPLVTHCAFAGSGAHVSWLFGEGPQQLTYRFGFIRTVLTLGITAIFIVGFTLPTPSVAITQSDQALCNAGEIVQQSNDTSIMTPAEGFIRFHYAPLYSQ